MHEIGTVKTSLIFRELRHTTEIPRRNHCALCDHTGYSTARARMDVGRVAACTLQLLAGFACLAIVRRRSDTDRDCHVSVLLALECVPHCERLSSSFARRPVRPFAPSGVVAVAVGAPQPDGLAQESALGLRVVPHAVELCDAGRTTPAPAGYRSLVLDAAALAARGGLGVEAGPVGRPRRRPPAHREAGPHPAYARNPGETGRGVVCRRTRYSLAAQGRLSVDAQKRDGQAGDARPEPETLPGWGAGAPERAARAVHGHT